MKDAIKGVLRVGLAVGLLAADILVALPSRADGFTNVGSMSTPRYHHTATLMQNGKVLVTGGNVSSTNILASAEIYDPATGIWSPTSPMSTARAEHIAVMLNNGKVLVAGGASGTNRFSSAEIYDPASGTWTLTGAMNSPRDALTAVRLKNGLILVAGGYDGTNLLGSAELYDPNSGTWTNTGSFGASGRWHLNLALLQNGQVLMAFGDQGNQDLVVGGTYLYDPNPGTWSLIKSSITTNSATPFATYATLTVLPDGRAVAAGGEIDKPLFGPVEIFDPSTTNWTLGNSMAAAVADQTATLLPNGQVLFTGSVDADNVRVSQLFNPATGLWSLGPVMNYPRTWHTATLLPDGRVLVAGGFGVATAELYDPTVSPTTGGWLQSPSTVDITENHSATLLPNGKVLVAGGEQDCNLTATAHLYDPSNGTWSNTGALTESRAAHTANLLPDGRVLVAGGADCATTRSSAEIYDPNTGSWIQTASMSVARASHAGILLRNGKVLVAGGEGNTNILSSAELYNPLAGTWTPTGSMNFNRYGCSAALLTDGRVLVAGGSYLTSAEIYDPATGIWTVTGSMAGYRLAGTATLLPNGKVLISGGDSQFKGTCELYDPPTGMWTSTGSLNFARQNHAAVLLPSGKVLVEGGINESSGVYVKISEIFDPLTGAWSNAGILSNAVSPSITLLPNGKVFAAYESIVTGTIGFYDEGLNFSNLWQPQIAAITSPIGIGSSTTITGSGFGGVSGGSSGTAQDSSTDYPLVQLRSIESGQVTFLLATNWSMNSFGSAPVTNFPPGFALATVFVNGIPSTSRIVNVTVPAPTPAMVKCAGMAASGGLQLMFTNTPGAIFGVWTATNPATPPANWTPLGAATEVSPGQFQFTDTQAANGAQRFYSLRAP